MSTLAIKFDDHAVDVGFTKTSVHFILADGREISAPLEWFPRLRDASDAERQGVSAERFDVVGVRKEVQVALYRDGI